MVSASNRGLAECIVVNVLRRRAQVWRWDVQSQLVLQQDCFALVTSAAPCTGFQLRSWLGADRSEQAAVDLTLHATMLPPLVPPSDMGGMRAHPGATWMITLPASWLHAMTAMELYGGYYPVTLGLS